MSVRRYSRREAIATQRGSDISDVETYQPGRTRVPVYLVDDVYVVALRGSERAPDGIADTWAEVGVSFGYRILRGTSEVAVGRGAGATDRERMSDYERMAIGLPPLRRP